MFNDTLSERQRPVREFCFSHLNYDVSISHGEENISWSMAFVIAIPMVIITMAIIKIVLVIKRKRAAASRQSNR